MLLGSRNITHLFCSLDNFCTSCLSLPYGMIYKKFCVIIALWVTFFALYNDITFLFSISCQKDWKFKPWSFFCHVDVELFTFTVCSSFHSFLFLIIFHISDTISSFKTRSTILQSHKLCQINNVSQVTKNVKLLNLLQGWKAKPQKVQFKYI